MCRCLQWSVFVLVCVFSIPATADDWPQWMGPGRNGVWHESGIVDTIPAAGLPVKWRMPVGLGYSGPAVSNGMVYVMDFQLAEGKVANSPDGVNELTGKERVVCFNADSGKQLWEFDYPQKYRISYASGPRCTPTVKDDKVYVVGAEGMLTCLDAQRGTLVWQKSLPETYNTKTPIWGYASHPLVDGDFVYTLAGGEGSVCVALHKDTGEEVWTALTADEPGYGTPTMITHAGTKQLLIWTPLSLNALNPRTGEVLWSVPLQPGFNMSIMAPQKLGNYLYASAIGNASALMKLDSDKPGAEILWRGKAKTSIYASNSTPLLDNDMIYGCDVETGALIGASLKDGERLWKTTKPTDNSPRRSRHATAFLTKQADRYFLFNELGDLIMAKLSREGYQELGRFHVLEPTNEAFGRPVVWSNPAYAERCLFARNDKELVCVDLAK